VTTRVVVSSIFLAGDDLLRMVQLAISASTDFVTDSRLKIDEDGARDVLAGTGLGEKGVERIITTANGLVGRHLAIGLDTVLKAVELPTGIARLDTSLTDMDR